MTYEELAQKILKLPENNQKQDVTVSCDISKECLPVKYFCQIRDDNGVAGGVLDAGHPILAIDF